MEAVKPPANEPQGSITGGDSHREFDRWTSAYSSSTASADDPASRFISALEQKPAAIEVEESIDADKAAEKPDPAATWVTPPPDEISTPAFSTWSYQASDPVDASVSSNDSGWKAPSSWGNQTEIPVNAEPTVPAAAIDTPTDTPVEAEPAVPEAAIDAPVDRDEIPAWGEESTDSAIADAELADEEDEDIDLTEATAPDAAGFHDGGSTEVDYLSGDENIDVSGLDTPSLAPQDARDRAISLVDELRRMVRLMPGGGMQDTGAAAMALTEASLKVSDFGDVREAIAELQEDPRDIQALTNLARVADKIELLLDEHASLAASIETALTELSGQD